MRVHSARYLIWSSNKPLQVCNPNLMPGQTDRRMGRAGPAFDSNRALGGKTVQTFQLVCQIRMVWTMQTNGKPNVQKIQTNYSAIQTNISNPFLSNWKQACKPFVCLDIQTGIQFRANRLQTNAKPDPEFENPVSMTAVYVLCNIIGV